MKERVLVAVDWVDSTSDNGWKTKREIEDLATGADSLDCFSCGLLIEESDDRIVISTSVNPLHDVVDPLAIPKCSITKIKRRTVASVFGPARKEAR